MFFISEGMKLLLLLLIGIPLLSAGIVRLAGHRMALLLAFISSLISAGLTIALLFNWPAHSGFHYLISYPWITSLGISFRLGMDGLGALMILLTNGMIVLILLSSFGRERARPATYFTLILLMQFAMNGVFLALDGFLFYVFWELALIPVWLISWLWGGSDSVRITMRFFIYTLTGSLLMLAAIIYLGIQSGEYNFSLEAFYQLKLSENQQALIFWLLFAAFAVKIPVFPFHSWQPDAYTDSPTQGSMLLSGIMLKMGLYGILRWLLPVVPDAVARYGHLVMVLAITGIVYASLMALAQTDFKRMIAYSSMAHVGLITAGLFSLKAEAIHGASLQMLAHGVNVVGLFFIADLLMHRMKTHQMNELGGLVHEQRWLAIFFLVLVLASIALPLTNAFAGEFMLLTGLYQYSPWTAFFAGLTVVLGAIYMLRAYKSIMLGMPHEKRNRFVTLMTSEILLLAILAILIFAAGIYPQGLLHLSGTMDTNILNRLN